jgi:fatty acyl-CoA reductase
MGEMLLGHLRGDYPLVIIRPSIITSTFKDPLPGWIEGIKTMDSVITGYAKQTVSLFLLDVNLIVDIIPGDMVVNAMLVAMAAHSEDKKTQIIYHVTSSLCNPATWAIVVDSMHRYFSDNPPCMGRNGEHVRLKKMKCFSTVAQLTLYTVIKYKIPIEMLRLVNIMLFGVFSPCYNNISRNYRFFMQLIEFYKPYVLFKGFFDDTNLENLKKAMNKGKNSNGADFDFDPKSIDWADYFYSVHIPGLLKYISD